MEIGAIFATAVETPEHIAYAEHLGYRYAFVYDSPTFLADPFVVLGRAIDRTQKIMLGVAVLTPRMRHLVANAGAIATLNTLARGRMIAVVGAGFTSQLMIGRRAAPWTEVEDYVVALRALLSGEEVEWEGSLIALCHGELAGVKLSPRVPLWIAAHGPKGYATAMRCGDGVVTYLTHGAQNDLDLSAARPFVLFYGTVLEEGEDAGSERVLHAAGPAAAFQLHLGGAGIVGNSAQWRSYQERVHEIDERRRHIAMHGRHLIEVTELERPLVSGDLILRTTETGSPAVIKERLGREFRQDSCGPGKFRGGLGVKTTIRTHVSAMYQSLMERTKCAPWGLLGGMDGMANRVGIQRANGEIERFSSGKVRPIRIDAGDVWIAEMGGGGGFGSPLERDVEWVVADVRAGYVSVESAKENYGVIVRQRGRIFELDSIATDAQRSTLKKGAETK